MSEESATIRGGPWPARAAAAGLGLLLIAAFAEPLATLGRQWLTHDRYSFGLLIPFLSGYLAWVRRDRVRAASVRPAYVAGSLALAGALAVLVAGRAAAVQILEQLSFVLVLPSLVLLVLGPRVLAALALPLAYLVLMVPVWEVATDPLHLPFQRFSAEVGSGILRTIGIPAYREGNRIELPRVVLDVAESCSGVNYLLAVLAIGLPLAVLFVDGWPRRVLLLCFAAVVAVASNAVRVALIGVLAMYGPRALSHGPFHVLQGLSVAAVGYAALFLGLRVLAGRRAGGAQGPARWAAAGGTRPGAEAGRLSPLALGVAGTLVVVALWAGRAEDLAPVPLVRDLSAFPSEIGGWRGTDVAPSVAVLREAGVDRDLARAYEGPGGARLELYVGYFERQAQGRELVSERVARMLPRGRTVLLPAGAGRTIAAARARLGGGADARDVWYWFDLNGRVTRDPYRVKLLTAWDVVASRRSNGALVLILAGGSVSGGAGLDEAGVADFAEGALPLLSTFLPRP